LETYFAGAILKKLTLLLSTIIVIASLCGCGGGGGGSTPPAMTSFVGSYTGTYTGSNSGESMTLQIRADGTVEFRDSHTEWFKDAFLINGTFDPATGQVTAAGFLFSGGDAGGSATFTGRLILVGGAVIGSGDWVFGNGSTRGTWQVQKSG